MNAVSRAINFNLGVSAPFNAGEVVEFAVTDRVDDVTGTTYSFSYTRPDNTGERSSFDVGATVTRVIDLDGRWLFGIVTATPVDVIGRCRFKQTISANIPTSPLPVNTTLTVQPSASSGLAVTAEVLDPTCTISGLSVTARAAGTCRLVLTQAGDADWYPVSEVFTITISTAQSITFAALSDRAFGTAPFTVSATASSGLAVAFSSDTTPVCTVSGTTVTLVAVGTCTIRATQPGNTTFNPATPVTRSFTVGYGITLLDNPARTETRRGATLPVKFRLTTANGTPITAATATTFRCPATSSTTPSVTVSIAGGTPVCATYQPATDQRANNGFFQADVKTTGIPTGTQPLVITVTLGTTTIATLQTTTRIV